MLTFEGKGIQAGVAIGKIKLWQKDAQTVKRRHIDDADAEMHRFSLAKEEAAKRLSALYDKALVEVGADGAAIFDIHRVMLDDGDYLDSVENIIRSEEVNAEYAVAATSENFVSMLLETGDEYMMARSADVKDISELLIKILTGADSSIVDDNELMIIAAEDLAPSETVQLDKSKVLAFVTEKGSANSHTAILARTMNIPAIIGVKIPDDCDNAPAIVDGASGKVYINPTDELREEMEKILAEEKSRRLLLEEMKGKDSLTLDGKKIKLYANIGNTKDLVLALQNDAEGIGLFRSEFIYLGRDSLPTEAEQFAVYKKVVQGMGDKKVIIRTLDIGADKQADYFNLCREENPAMGLRAIRLCLTRPDIFKTQLRALFRAAALGNLSVMYPMITSMAEVKRIKAIVKEIEEELTRDGIPYKTPEQGIMIETPAAVMISDKLAKEFSFFSIGTNDLAQYTLAIDRQNPCLDEFFEFHSEAVLRMIELVVKNAHKAGIWAGICGELAADTTITETLLKYGVDELSVSPSRILSVRKKIRETDIGNINLK
ncbi:MAG: phosphoenolpyruvate--protein phosphotransferase [Clostridia bacterium]|nr:phosphoenolpyruvate--protein phosphotransferase [Clostridia bacterium]